MTTVLSAKWKMALGSCSSTFVSRKKFFRIGPYGVPRIDQAFQRFKVRKWRRRCSPLDLMKTWKCTICGCVDGSDAAPAHCTECGARDTMFVASDEPPHGIEHNPLQPRD